MKKAMTIGISPNYNYPGSLKKWQENNTYYASNYGGSFITRAIMKEFNADYIDDFSDIKGLKEKYNICYMSLATHAHTRRDLSKYVVVLEKLQMKVVVLSLGVQDYLSDPNVDYKLHPSVIRLLKIASESTNWIGVRGPYTASILNQNGFKNVIPIGCPTVYWNMTRDFQLNLKEKYERSLIVYHKSIAKYGFLLIKGKKAMGQDFQDQVTFTETLSNDIALQRMESNFYKEIKNNKEIYEYIKKFGYFPFSFDDWFNELANSDFVFGPRLHGVIGSLVQGVPAILAIRDLRTREMSEFYNLPSIDYKKLDNYKFEELVKLVDYPKFIETYKCRYDNYVAFINENKLESGFVTK